MAWLMDLNRKPEDDLLDLSGLPLAGTQSPTAGPVVDPYTQTTTSTHTGGGGSSTSRVVETPEAKRLRGELPILAQRDRDIAEKQAAAEKAKAEAMAQDASALATEQAAQAAETRYRREQLAAHVADKQKTIDEASEKYAQAKPSEYWSDKSAGQKFLAGLGVALGAIGSGLTGRPNGALELLQQQQKQHYEREQDKIEKMANEIGIKRGNLAAAERFRDKSLDDLEAKQTGMLKWMRATTDDKLRRLGISDADRAKDVRILQIDKALNDNLSERQERLARRVTTTSQAPSTTTSTTTVNGVKPGAAGAVPGGKLSEGEQKSADYLNRMLEDEKIIRSVPPVTEQGRKLIRDQAALEALAEKNPTADALAKVVAGRQTLEEKLSADDRRAYKAGSRLAATSLRGDSGAAISAGEYLNFDRQYLPGQGDKETDLADKENGRRKLLEGMATRTGRPQEHLPKIQALPRQTNVGSEGVIRDVNGKPARVYPDGTYEYLDSKGK